MQSRRLRFVENCMIRHAFKLLVASVRAANGEMLEMFQTGLTFAPLHMHTPWVHEVGVPP